MHVQCTLLLPLTVLSATEIHPALPGKAAAFEISFATRQESAKQSRSPSGDCKPAI
jgi:hypothetical protein